MSIFDKAKKIEAPEAAKGKKDDKEKIHVDGLSKLAVVDAVVKAFTALQSTLDESVKDEMANTFIGIATQTKKRPENFRGIDGAAVSASCEMRKRSSASPLSEDEVTMLKQFGVPIEEITVREDAYVINPVYFSDSEMLEKVSKALEKVKGLPEDFILRQEKVTKKVVSDATIDVVFEKGLGRSLMNMVTTLAVKPVFKGSLKEALDKVLDMAGLAEEAVESQKAKPAKKGK